MRRSSVLVLVAVLPLFACQVDDGEGDDANASADEGESEASADDESDAENDDDSDAQDDDGDDDASATTDPGDVDDSDDGSSDPTGDSDDDASDESSSDDGPDGGADQLPPTDAAALVPWLEAESYASWAAESAPHVSAGPHGAAVRTFFNDALADAAAAGAGDYPIGAASVKELFDAQGERNGWAVIVKTELGQAGDGWYWYEIVGASVYADGPGVALCTGCHVGGTDFVLTGWPLQ